MSAVAPANSTVSAMRTLVRRLTACASEAALTTGEIDNQLNSFINQDFPYAIKIDQMRSVFTFFTQPNVQRYPVDVNYNMGMRGPFYVEGIQGQFFKDRQQYYNLWPRFPSFFQESPDTTTVLTGNVTGITQTATSPSPCIISSVGNGLTTGAQVTFSGVGGMTQLNGNTYTITVINANTFQLNGVDNFNYGAYTSGGTWTSNSAQYDFMIGAPFLRYEVVMGGTDSNGNPFQINDDGNGNLQLLSPNPVVSVPLQNTNPAKPGMYNQNTANPGLYNPINIGTVNYTSGQFFFNLGFSLQSGTLLNVWVSQVTLGRPWSCLFWNNFLEVRPVPDKVYKCEIESFLTPIQFMLSNDVPILNQWWRYIGYGASMEILRQRQDMAGVENLREGFMRQEALVLERQSVEEIFTPNYTLFNSTSMNPVNGGWSQGTFT